MKIYVLVFVLISVEPSEAFLDFIQEVLKCLQPAIGELNLVDDFHISVSRTFPIRHHWIDPLATSLRDGILNVYRSASFTYDQLQLTQGTQLFATGALLLEL
jgi:hypothetical protein